MCWENLLRAGRAARKGKTERCGDRPAGAILSAQIGVLGTSAGEIFARHAGRLGAGRACEHGGLAVFAFALRREIVGAISVFRNYASRIRESRQRFGRSAQTVAGKNSRGGFWRNENRNWKGKPTWALK